MLILTLSAQIYVCCGLNIRFFCAHFCSRKPLKIAEFWYRFQRIFSALTFVIKDTMDTHTKMYALKGD